MTKLIKCKQGIIKEMTLEDVIKEFEKMTHTKDIFKWMYYYEKDDLTQMAYMGLMKAYEYYDISLNRSFIDYAGKVIQDVIAHTYKKDNRQMRKINSETSSIYSIVNDTEDVELIETIADKNCNCEESALSNIMNKEINEVLNKFSKQEQKMINLYFIKGLNYAEIGRICDKTRECIRYRIKQITNKLKVYLQDTGIQSCM